MGKTLHARFLDGPDRRRAKDGEMSAANRTHIATIYAADCRATRDGEDLNILQPDEEGQDRKIFALHGSAFGTETNDDGTMHVYHTSSGTGLETSTRDAVAARAKPAVRVLGLVRANDARPAKPSAPPIPRENSAAVAMQRRHEDLRAAEKAKATRR